LLAGPLLAAWRRMSRRGVSRVNDPLVMPGPLTLTLLVVNWPQGAERYQGPLPQSMTPLGYWPLRLRSWPARSSKMTVIGVGAWVGAVVAVAVKVPVEVGLGVRVT